MPFDRDAQFRYIAKQVRAFQKEGQPVISVDSKKRELIGNYKNPGREWRPGGKWQTEIANFNVSANSWSDTFHNRQRLALLPPESAVINNRAALG